MTNKPNQKLHYGHWLDGAREDQWQPFQQLDLVDLIKNVSLNSDRRSSKGASVIMKTNLFFR